MKQVHQHFSENFGPIHRIYFGHDFHELFNDTQDFIQSSRLELDCQIKTEKKYYQLREQITSNEEPTGDKDDLTIEKFEA